MREQVGRVYFVRCTGTGLIKIGYTAQCAVARLRNLQVGSASELTLLGAVAVSERDADRRYHQVYSDRRVRGEWFRLDKPNVEACVAGRVLPEITLGIDGKYVCPRVRRALESVSIALLKAAA